MITQIQILTPQAVKLETMTFSKKTFKKYYISWFYLFK